jgi:MFS family permease
LLRLKVVESLEASMRRVTGFVLTVLGAFLIVVAALLRFWLAPSAAKFPLNEYQVVTLSGTGSYFSQSQLQELNGVGVKVTFTIKGDTSAGNSTNAVWGFFENVQDTTNNAPIANVPYREAFNRRTGQLVDCCGEFVSDPVTGKSNHSVQMSGLGLFFPIGAQKQTYSIFDPTAARTEQATYQGTAEVDGILAYKYVEKVNPTMYGTDQVPGNVLGSPSSTVPLGEYYSATNTFYIDPETGAPLDTSQTQSITLGTSPSNVQIQASQVSVIETGASIAQVVSSDQSARNKLTLAQVILPVIGLALGLVLLVVGIILLRSGRDDDRQEPAWMGSRQLNTYPESGPRYMFLAITVVATITLYYELYVGGSVSTLILPNLHMTFTFYVTVLAFGNLIGAFGSLFAGLADRIGRANIVVIGLFFTGVFTAFVLPAATSKWTFSIEGFVVGVVEGMALVATPALIRDFSPQVGRAAAMGFWTAGPVAGSLIVTAVATNTIPAVINDQRFWTHEYHICGAVGLVVFFIAFFGLRELSPQLRDQLMVTMRDRMLIEARARGLDVERLLHRPFRQLLRADVVVSALAIALMLLIYYTAVAFGLIYLTSVFGFSVKDANGLGNWNWGFNVIAVILVGILSDLVRVRKPFMVIGGIGAAVMTIIYLEEAGHHPGYYTVALMLAGLAFFLGVAYTPWMASFTETVEDRNPALIATGLAIWGWVLRVVVFASFLVLPHVVTSVTPLVDYGTTAQQYQATYPKQIAFASSHPAIVAEAQKYAPQLATAQRIAPELAVLESNVALFARLSAYSNPNSIPASLAAQAVAAAGGGTKGIAMLTNIQNDQAAIESVISVQLQLDQLKPYAAQLEALSKVPPQVFPFLLAHKAALTTAQAQAPGQWKNWYWACFGGIVFFVLCIPLVRGRWSPSAARRDEEEHEAATRAELAALANAGSDLAGAGS